MRLVAAKLDPAAAQRARRRRRRKAQKAGRTITASTLAVAGWLLLITTLDAGSWSTADVLYVYRARWQVELVFKKMKQLLRLNQLRTKHPASVEATVRALLVAWALHEGTTTLLRTLLRATATTERAVVSSWLLSGLGLDTLRQQVQGTGLRPACRRACLVCGAFCAVDRGVGDIKNPLCGHGWSNSPAPLKHGDRLREGEQRGMEEYPLSTRIWGNAPLPVGGPATVVLAPLVPGGQQPCEVPATIRECGPGTPHGGG